MKYFKQKTPHDCAVAVILNACIWSGKPVDYEIHGNLYKKKLGYKDNIGVFPENFDKFIKNIHKYSLPFKVVDIIEIPTIKEIKESLAKNNAVILGVAFKQVSHIGLIVKIDNNYVTLVNWFGKGIVRKIHVNTLRAWLRKWSIVYILEKV